MDWRTPKGYLFAVIIAYAMVGFAYFAISCILSLVIGAFWFIISSTEDTQRILRSINHNAHSNRNRSNKLKSRLLEFILTHGLTKQLSEISIFCGIIDGYSVRLS